MDQEGEHIRALNALNETLIQLDEAKEESKEIKKALNDSFYMLFGEDVSDWRTLPFVLPEVLRKSRYSNSVACCLRYCRNLIIHAGQHREALRKHFGRELKEVDVLREVLARVPRLVVHGRWFARRFLPQLASVAGSQFPWACVQAYEQQMEAQRQKIGEEKLAQLRRDMEEPSYGTAIHPDLDSMQEVFKRSHQVS